jgi:hypothetical protein
VASFFQRTRSLRALVDEAVDADWRHPAWWTFLLGTAALEGLARPADGELYAAFLGANGGPRSDTFMAVPQRPAVDRWDEAMRRARAAWAAIERLDGTLPGQPLRVALQRRDGWLRAEPLGPGRPVVIETAQGLRYADLQGEKPQLDTRPIAAPILVSMIPQRLGDGRHLHRRAWGDAPAPWLGIGDAEGHGIVTTCHLAVDGYGHAQLTRAIFPDPDPSRPSVSAPGELDFAGAVMPRVSFVAAAHALGLALTEVHGARGDRSPSFQIPFVPGDRADRSRLRGRVSFTLASLRHGEDRETFGARLRAQLDREAREAGLLTRILAATVYAPFPESVRRRLLAGNREPSPHLPPTEALAGRASLAYLRFPDEDRAAAPLYAESSPPVWDRAGSVSMTLVDHGAQTTASIAASGAISATDFLARWRRLAHS